MADLTAANDNSKTCQAQSPHNRVPSFEDGRLLHGTSSLVEGAVILLDSINILGVGSRFLNIEHSTSVPGYRVFCPETWHAA